MSKEKNNILDDDMLEEVSGGAQMTEKTVFVGEKKRATTAFNTNKNRKAKGLTYTTDKGNGKSGKGQSINITEGMC